MEMEMEMDMEMISIIHSPNKLQFCNGIPKNADKLYQQNRFDSFLFLFISLPDVIPNFLVWFSMAVKINHKVIMHHISNLDEFNVEKTKFKQIS